MTIIAAISVVIVVVMRLISMRRRETVATRHRQTITMTPESDEQHPTVTKIDARDPEGNVIPGSREYRGRRA